MLGINAPICLMTLAWGLRDKGYMLFRKAGGSKQETTVEDLRDTKWRVSLMMLIMLLVATIGDVPKRMDKANCKA